MKKMKQLFYHDPDNGEFGDCDRTCYACLLDMESPDGLANWGVYHNNVTDFQRFKKEVLATMGGVAHIQIAYPGSYTLDEILNAQLMSNPGIYFIVCGTSACGCGHSVIALNGEIIWDPSRNDSGIVGPMADGLWWTEYVVPITLVNKGE